ncbi:MAG: 16S rRNA (guanine(527)-N(7))-methyltransferase RsmG, partial [Selenomonadaceae bacterium]|nr:16S rRNA (guanine(527)-N(7))-methyltransferase RsmG [Selenomonadaceae bacterium]
FCLIDSLNKRVEFLKRVVAELELDGVEIFHGRAEELSRQKIFREQFDAVTSRAVARLNILAEYCLPFVKVGGVFVALKGKNFREELDEARAAIKILGGGKIFIREIKLPTLDDSRAVIYIDKKKSTPEKFPRRESLIRTKILGDVT